MSRTDIKNALQAVRALRDEDDVCSMFQSKESAAGSGGIATPELLATAQRVIAALKLQLLAAKSDMVVAEKRRMSLSGQESGDVSGEEVAAATELEAAGRALKTSAAGLQQIRDAAAGGEGAKGEGVESGSEEVGAKVRDVLEMVGF